VSGQPPRVSMAKGRITGTLFVAAAAGALVCATEPEPARIGGKRTLVLAEDASIERSHSQFLDGLKGERARARAASSHARAGCSLLSQLPRS
jgi:hypothetical protein